MKWKNFLFCLLISFITLLFTSESSILYPINTWVDVHAIFTMGKGMMHGLVPYVDLFEQKGPIFIFLFGLASLLSSTSFLGLFIIEILCLAVFLYYIQKIIQLFLPLKYLWLLTPLFAVFTTTSPFFAHGGSVEEICLPFLAISLYHLISFFQTEEISYRTILIDGLLAGIVWMMKYTILGFWFAFAVIIFFFLLSKKQVRESFYHIFVFLMGMMIPFFLCSLYFITHHGFPEFIHVYFIVNLFHYSEPTRNILFLVNPIILFIKEAFHEPLFLLSVMGSGYALYLSKISRKIKISILFLFLCMVYFTLLGGLPFVYYFLPFLPIVLLGMCYFLYTYQSKLETIFFSKQGICLLTVFMTIELYLGANYKENLLVKKEDVVVWQYKDIIQKEENQTLLNYGFIDFGLFFTTNTIPTTYYFERLNFDYDAYPDNMDALNQSIIEKRTNFVLYPSLYSKLSINQEKITFIKKYYDLIEDEIVTYENQKYQLLLFKRKQ